MTVYIRKHTVLITVLENFKKLEIKHTDSDEHKNCGNAKSKRITVVSAEAFHIGYCTRKFGSSSSSRKRKSSSKSSSSLEQRGAPRRMGVMM